MFKKTAAVGFTTAISTLVTAYSLQHLKIKGLSNFNGNIKRCPLKLHIFNDFFLCFVVCLIKNSVTELIFLNFFSVQTVCAYAYTDW